VPLLNGGWWCEVSGSVVANNVVFLRRKNMKRAWRPWPRHRFSKVNSWIPTIRGPKRNSELKRWRRMCKEDGYPSHLEKAMIQKQLWLWYFDKILKMYSWRYILYVGYSNTSTVSPPKGNPLTSNFRLRANHFWTPSGPYYVLRVLLTATLLKGNGFLGHQVVALRWVYL